MVKVEYIHDPVDESELSEKRIQNESRIKIALACGWTAHLWRGCTVYEHPIKPGIPHESSSLPDFLSSVDEMRDAEISTFKTPDTCARFYENLKTEICMSGKWPTFDVPDWMIPRADARDHANAFLKTIQ